MTISVPSSSLDFEIPRPKDVGVLAMETYFPRRVCIPLFGVHSLHMDSYTLNSASPRPIWKNLMASPRANTLLALVKNTWPGLMIGKTSTRSP